MSVFTCATDECTLSHGTCDSAMLLPNPETVDDGAIARIVDAAEVIQQPTSASDELQEASP